MKKDKILDYNDSFKQAELQKAVSSNIQYIYLKGLIGSYKSIISANLIDLTSQVIVLNDKEEAAYFYNDLVQILGDKKIFFLPSTYNRSPEYGNISTSNVILRTEALNHLSKTRSKSIIVTYPLALFEKVPKKNNLKSLSLNLNEGDSLGRDFIVEKLVEHNFERVDFVYEPGQFSVRGSIIDIYSFSNEDPYRIDLFGEEIDSIRIFDLETQLSKGKLTEISIIPNINNDEENKYISFLDFISSKTYLLFSDIQYTIDKINDIYGKIQLKYSQNSEEGSIPSENKFINGNSIKKSLGKAQIIEFGSKAFIKESLIIEFNSSPQPVFKKNFNLLEQDLKQKQEEAYQCYILSDNKKQLERLKMIFEDKGSDVVYSEINKTLHEGFINHDSKVCFYTDHQIFDRYHKFILRTDKARIAKQALSIKELSKLTPGDYVVHTDHGIAKFGGLVIANNDGKQQETIKLIFRDNDVLLVNIHSLHRISKYKGKDGTQPKINKLGTPTWQKKKDKTKSKVKDIARELIKLYAERKNQPGFAFSPDTFMQTELEASFIYEDTPDQEKSTKMVKEAMERSMPMDMLVCGDVGFGKTEIAIRAAFKAVSDNKQVAVLVPTTILAMQHYNTFTERLKDFPCNVDYISRLRGTKKTKEAIKNLKEGKVDILIGTHRLVSKDVQFKDMGLLIVDEEQRFGVSMKEKLKKLKVNVDTLTLSATPIPRTLQFSLMGARDLSILRTPPPNRHPILTEVHTLNDDIIKEAIQYEIDRNGQVFFIHNRIQNIYEVQAMINRLLPHVKTIVAHGQMEGRKLEQIMFDFINGDYDVLIATTIIESGLDIPNANTIIINQANNYGLSELHQLRGRVGRANKKAFCYLIAPPLSTLKSDSQRRLKIIEEFSDLGSGFNIAMQDLDIRGAGNLLGGEQSGFISDIGFETYQRILNEAILELKEDEFKNLYQEEQISNKDMKFVTDCTIETDHKLIIPSDYVENVSERMVLYRRLDEIQDDDNLDKFKDELIDRFGEIPEVTKQLMLITQIRREAMSLGFEKIIYKNNTLYISFISNQNSPYFQTDIFVNILKFFQENKEWKANIKEKNSKLKIIIRNIKNVYDIKHLFDNIKIKC